MQSGHLRRENTLPTRRRADGHSGGNREGEGAPGTPLTQPLSALAAADPCQPSPCSPLARCSMTPKGQAQCHCPENYHGDGSVCLPQDPCLTNFGGCPSNSTFCLYRGPGKVSELGHLLHKPLTHSRQVPGCLNPSHAPFLRCGESGNPGLGGGVAGLCGGGIC